MPGLSTRALVLRRVDYGESNRVVTLATESMGTISAVARSARRSARRFGGGLEFFTLVDATLEHRREDDPWALSKVRVLAYHSGFAEDVARLAAGSYAVEMYRMIVPEEVVEPAVFRWLAGFMERWEHALPGPADLAAEEIVLLSMLGHAPRFDACVSCGKPAPDRAWGSFDPGAGGIVCRACGGSRTGTVRIGSRVRAFLTAVTEGGPGAAARDSDLQDGVLPHVRALRDCMDGYVRALAERDPRSMRSLRRAWGL